MHPTECSFDDRSTQDSAAAIRARHAEMYRAVTDELLTAYTHEHPHPLMLSEGVLRKTSGFYHLYEFGLSEPVPHLRPGQDVLGVFGAIQLACTVVEVQGCSVCLALPRHLGGRIDAGGTVLTDMTFLHEALLRRLTAGIRGFTLGEPCSPQFNGEAALRIIGAGAFAASERFPRSVVFQHGPALNEAQRHALLLAFRSNACYLLGPPGTGKTTTLARVVEAHVLEGRSVLVLGPTNRAVDLLMRAVAQRLLSGPVCRAGRVLRLGAGSNPALLGAHADQVCLERVADRTRSHRYEPALQRLDRLAAACHAEEQAVTEQLKPNEGRQGPNPRPDLIAILHRRLERIVRRLRRINAQQRQVQRASALLPRRLLEQCDVLGTTIHQTYLSPEFRRQFDVVVIDEASMVPALLVYVSAGLAKAPDGRVIVAGDYRQLSPIARAATTRALTWLRTDIFHLVGIPRALDDDGALPHVGVLNLQHRMSPGICSLVSRLFYRDRLRTADAVQNRIVLPSPLGGGDVFYVDSSQSEPLVRRVSGLSRANALHVDLIEDLLAELDSGGAITKSGRLAVAVISPFRGQVRALEERLGNRYAGRDVKVTTAHGGQGDEAEIVILDLTDAPGLPISGFLGSTRHPEEGARLLNVSMSRARQQLYVLGAFDYLKRFGNHITRDLIDYLRENTELVPLQRFQKSSAQVYGPRPSRVA